MAALQEGAELKSVMYSGMGADLGYGDEGRIHVSDSAMKLAVSRGYISRDSAKSLQRKDSRIYWTLTKKGEGYAV